MKYHYPASQHSSHLVDMFTRFGNIFQRISKITAKFWKNHRQLCNIFYQFCNTITNSVISLPLLKHFSPIITIFPLILEHLTNISTHLPFLTYTRSILRLHCQFCNTITNSALPYNNFPKVSIFHHFGANYEIWGSPSVTILAVYPPHYQLCNIFSHLFNTNWQV